MRLPRHSWLALYWGGSQIDSDVVIFKANGYNLEGDSISPEVYDCWSYSYNETVCETGSKQHY